MADDDEKYTGAIVALIPAESDPITAASSEPAHVTLVYMGDDAESLDREALLVAVRNYAEDLTPITVPTKERGELGDDSADVVFLEPTDSLLAVRAGILEDEAVRAAHDAVEQYPEWTPHVTLGYPETPAAGEYDVADNPSVTFDRIGLWMGGIRTDFKLSGQEASDEESVGPDTEIQADAAAVVADELVEDGEMPYDEPEDDEEEITEIPVHGVLAPEGVPTGDGRMFREGSLKTRNLPVPLRYQILDSHGGDTSHVVTVGRVEEVWREGNMVRFRGAIVLSKQYAQEVIEGIVDRTIRGVSIDGDDGVVEVGTQPETDEEWAAWIEENGGMKKPLTVFASIRVAGLTIVAIPAYQEAYIALGHEFQEDLSDEEKADQDAILADCGCAPTAAEVAAYRDVPADERKKLADEDKAMDDGSYPIANEDDLRNAIQAIGRAKDPDKVKAHIKRRARALGKEGLIPEGWSAALVADATFAPGTHDGPGWITHPIPTSRIRRYWVRGKGAAKIGWGAGGDFYRCRSQLRKYVQNPDWLSGLCANMHKEATGIWPGQHDAHAAQTVTASAAPPVRFIDDTYPEFDETGTTLVAAAGTTSTYPAEWFADPKFDKPTPLTVDKETGRVSGHLAVWGTCHVGIPGVCTTPPQSKTNYAVFKTGIIDTDQGPLRVGKLTAGVGHPNPRLRAAAATRHYDKPEAVRAFVNVGEDAHGIWYSGVLAPWVTEDQVDQFRMVGTLSGDWRYVNGSLELIAAVSVASPGFPVPAFAVEHGQQMSLVAGGALVPEAEESWEDIVSRIAASVVAAYENRQKKRERLVQAKARLRAHRLAVLRGKIEED